MLLLLASPAAGESAETDRIIEIEYLVTYLGLPVYTARMHGTVNATRYKLQFHADPQGIARLGSSTRISWETRGAVVPAGFEPRAFRQSHTWRKQTRRIEISFAPDADPDVRVMPPERPGKRPAVPEAMRRGTVDPLTAVMAAVSGDASREPCAFNAQVFEGLRRTDVEFTPDGREKLTDIDVPGAGGKAAICLLHLKRLAGYERKAMEEHPEPLPPARLWIVHMAEAGLWLPVQLRFESSHGPVYARLVRARHRTNGRP